MKQQKIKKKLGKKAAPMLSEFMKIFLGILVVLLLASFAYSMWDMSKKNVGEEQAKSSIETVYLSIKNVIDGKVSESEFSIESPDGWMIQAWPNKWTFKKPEQCREVSCICICPAYTFAGTNLFSTWEKALKECNSKGVCKDFSKEIKTIDKYDYENALEVKSSKDFKVSMENERVIVKEMGNG